MDKLFEIEVVRTFFNKHYQERIIYELTSKKKRVEAISRLCHNFENVLNCNYMKKYDGSAYEDILKTLRLQGAQKTCYVISYNSIIDGKYMNLDEALKIAVGDGMPSLVVCKPNELAYFESEQIQGPPARFILKK